MFDAKEHNPIKRKARRNLQNVLQFRRSKRSSDPVNPICFSRGFSTCIQIVNFETSYNSVSSFAQFNEWDQNDCTMLLLLAIT